MNFVHTAIVSREDYENLARLYSEDIGKFFDGKLTGTEIAALPWADGKFLSMFVGRLNKIRADADNWRAAQQVLNSFIHGSR